MKIKDIAQQYNINSNSFESYLKQIGVGRVGIGGYTLDKNIESHVKNYKAWLTKQRALSNMLITSGFSFDGYKITKYSGYISGDDCKTMPRENFWGSDGVADNLCSTLVAIRRQAINELKEAAYNLGCNAVIGVDFDYMTMDPQHASFFGRVTVYEPYVICVTANGNAVIIEKD